MLIITRDTTHNAFTEVHRLYLVEASLTNPVYVGPLPRVAYMPETIRSITRCSSVFATLVLYSSA